MHKFSINYNELYAVSKAAAKQKDERYYLTGVYIYDSGEKRCFCATNGHILFYSETKRQGVSLERPLIIGGKFIKPTKEMEENIEMQILNDNLVVFGNAEFSLTGKVIKGTYPDFWKIFPSKRINETVFGALDPSYLKAVYNFIGKRVAPKAASEDGPLFFVNGARIAALMPIRADTSYDGEVLNIMRPEIIKQAA